MRGQNSTYQQLRKPIAPPTQAHGHKGYDRVKEPNVTVFDDGPTCANFDPVLCDCSDCMDCSDYRRVKALDS